MRVRVDKRTCRCSGGGGGRGRVGKGCTCDSAGTDACRRQHVVFPRLQALVYDILPSSKVTESDAVWSESIPFR